MSSKTPRSSGERNKGSNRNKVVSMFDRPSMKCIFYLAAVDFFAGLPFLLMLRGTLRGTSVQLDFVQAHHIRGLLLLLAAHLVGAQRLVHVVQLVLERVLDVLAQVDVVVYQAASLLRHGRYLGGEAAAGGRERRVRVGQNLHRRGDLLCGHSLARVLLLTNCLANCNSRRFQRSICQQISP